MSFIGRRSNNRILSGTEDNQQSKNSIVLKIDSFAHKFHDNMACYIKGFKRLFVKEGVSMGLFRKITQLFNTEQFDAIDNIRSELNRVRNEINEPRYFKYMELINYCHFLTLFRTRDIWQRRRLGLEYLKIVDLRKELGRQITMRVKYMISTEYYKRPSVLSVAN